MTNKVLAKVTRQVVRVYIGKDMYQKGKRKDKMIQNAMEIERKYLQILDSKNRICQETSDNKDRKETVP